MEAGIHRTRVAALVIVCALCSCAPAAEEMPTDFYPPERGGLRDAAIDAPPPDAYVVPTCGDGVTEGYEACDDGDLEDGDYCASDCLTVTGACGDAVIQENEGCDADAMPDGVHPDAVCGALCQVLIPSRRAYRAVGGTDNVCVLRGDGTVRCAGDGVPEIDPDARFRLLAHTGSLCGVLEDENQVTCYHPASCVGCEEDAAALLAWRPSERIVGMDGAWGWFSFVRQDGRVESRTLSSAVSRWADLGSHYRTARLEGAGEGGCGIRTDGTLNCWGFEVDPRAVGVRALDFATTHRFPHWISPDAELMTEEGVQARDVVQLCARGSVLWYLTRDGRRYTGHGHPWNRSHYASFDCGEGGICGIRWDGAVECDNRAMGRVTEWPGLFD